MGGVSHRPYITMVLPCGERSRSESGSRGGRLVLARVHRGAGVLVSAGGAWCLHFIEVTREAVMQLNMLANKIVGIRFQLLLHGIPPIPYTLVHGLMGKLQVLVGDDIDPVWIGSW